MRHRAFEIGFSLLVLVGCGTSEKAPTPPAPPASIEPVSIPSAPLPSASAPPIASVAPVTSSAPSAEPAKPAPIACKTDDDCWVGDDRKPIARPAKFRGKKLVPCKDSERIPACSDGACTVRFLKC